MEVEHSRLLKFFKEGRNNKPEMAQTPEIPIIKIEKDYQNPPNVESEVPGTHEIREYADKNNSSDTEITDAGNDENNSSEIKITGADFTLSPVITVTKNESTLTKGDMKLQKVVTEDIAEEESENGGYRISREESLMQTDRQPDSISIETSETRERDTEKMEGEEKSQDEKKSKIPMLRLRQAVEKVKSERKAQNKKGEKPRSSSIPKLKDPKIAIKRDTSLNFQPAVDDEFDKLYEEIVDIKQKDIEEKLPSVTMEDPEKIETKFEEIIHAYDENEHEKQTVSRVSKIPALKKKDEEGPSRITALIDRAKEKSVRSESKLKDGGFKVTATSIKTKRFSRGGSKDLSGEEHQIEVTETIDIKESGDNDVFVKETVKTVPAKPVRTFRNITKRIVADQKIDNIETKENIKDGGKQKIVTESLDKKDGTQNKTKRFSRTVSKETRERNLNRELSRNLENIRREFKDKIEDARIDPEFNNDENHIIVSTVTGNAQATPVKTERIIRGISREMNKDGQNINSNETVTVEELDDGGTRTITTKTTENLIIGTPLITEKIIRNISREISTDGQNNSIKGVTTVEETTDGGSKKVTKETYVKEHAKGIPVKTERFTRGISREMGNINLRNSREFITATENLSPGDNTQVLKKETMKTEQIEREGIKVGIPVFTKITRSFSKGKIQNVEMSRTIEWKPADEVKTKNFSRSVSEKVTKSELKDAGKWKYEAPTALSEVTDVNNKLTEQTNITPKDPVLGSKIKDTVKDIASKITTKKVSEYKSEEQVTNVEKTTFTLSSHVDLNVDRDFKVSREIGTQMSMNGKASDRNYKFIKEVGTQISVEGKYLDSPFDRDFKLAKERNSESKLVVSTIDGDPKESKESSDSKMSRKIGTQMSIVGKIVDRDYKVSKEIGTQMSLEGTSHVANSTKINEASIVTGTVNKKNETAYGNMPTQEKDSDVEEVTILKGNVSRMKDKIVKETVVTSKKEPDEELPKKKSVLSKIAIFERLEPKEPYPAAEVPTRKIKCKYTPPNLNRTNSADRPKIVDEVLKEQTQFEPLQETSKVEIGLNYDEVTYRNEPVIVRKSWRTAIRNAQNVTDVKQTNTDTIEATSLNQQEETIDFEKVEILPETINFETQESRIEIANDVNNKPQIQREGSVIEMPIIIPARINYEADIGKTKPGKINLNIWSSQVEKNKSSVDKIDFLREESLYEIAQTLPGKVDFESNESHVPVSRDLPGNIDLTEDDNKIYEDTILPWKIDFNSEEGKFEVADSLLAKPESKTDDSQAVTGGSPDITHGYLVDDVTPLPSIINFKPYEIQSEIATTLPGVVNSTQTEIDKTLKGEIAYTSAKVPIEHPKMITNIKENLKPETRQKEVGVKPKPGKINLNLWQNQIAVNQTLVGKTDIKRAKDAEIAKALSGRSSFRNFNRRAKVTENVQQTEHKAEIGKTSTGKIDISLSRGPIEEANILPGKIDLDITENNVDTAKPLLGFVDFNSNETQVATVRTLPETLNFSSTSSQVEVSTTLPENIDFNYSENQIDEPKILVGKIEFETEFAPNESKAEISEMLENNIYFSSIQQQTEGFTSLSEQTSVERVGKLDLKAWEQQVEVNKTLVDKIDVVKGEHLEEIAKTLPGKIDVITYETRVGEARMFEAPVDLNTDENKVEITEIDVDTETDEYKADGAKILPETIELDPFKHTPRFNPLPMLIRLNSQENKDLKDNITKVEIAIDSDPRETLSDPELVDEDPVVAKLKKDSTIENIKRKLYFITSKSSDQNDTTTPLNTPVPTETDNVSEKRVDELFDTIYNLDQESDETETWSYISSATAKTYEIAAETIEESNTNNVRDDSQNNSAAEYELDSDTHKVQSKLTKSGRSDVDDFITPTENIKQYKNVTSEYGFNFDIPKLQNQFTRSAYGVDNFKTSTEELKRAKSLAELDLGGVVNGQVKRIVGRIKSVDFSRRDSVRTEINIKEMPKKLSVLEKIALFEVKPPLLTKQRFTYDTEEGKTARARYESTTIRTSTTKTSTTPVISEEVYLKKIEELTTGKTKFGRLEEMLYLPLANGKEIPILALGTALIDPRLLPHVIGAAIDMGYRAIDTAYIYGNEKEIGQAIKAKIDDGTVKREDLFIMSKLWSTFHRSDLVEGACKASLANMGLDYFDLYLIHNPMSLKEGGDPIPKIATVLQYSQSDYLDAWFGMEGLVSKGLVKSIGVSNFNSQQIQKILDKGRLKPVVNQVECHPYLSQQRLHAFCAERDIILSCFGVLGSKGTPAEYKNSTTSVIDDALVKVMASGLNVSPAQLLIRYQIESGHNVVVKSSSAAHLWDNLQALTFKLDQPQIDALNALNRNKRTFTFKGMGDTHKNYPFLAAY